jgi:hypothetical protein
MLAGVNLVYFLRAKTEERHLRADPAYVAYAAWIEQHGLFAHIGRLLGLRPKLPAATAG